MTSGSEEARMRCGKPFETDVVGQYQWWLDDKLR